MLSVCGFVFGLGLWLLQIGKHSHRPSESQAGRPAEDEEESDNESEDDIFESAENLKYLRLGAWIPHV